MNDTVSSGPEEPGLPAAGDAPDSSTPDQDLLPEAQFEDLPAFLQEACGRAGWSSLMPVQAKAIPYLVEGHDLIVQSRTGSGKTGAFLLPIMQVLNPDAATCQALILTPTRELALQVFKEAELLGESTGIRAVSVYGGVSYGPQIEAFKKGAHIVIGTPGRVLDHLMNGALDLDRIETMVFDEADRLMSMGFYPDMQKLKRYLPQKRCTAMFSATFPAEVQRLAREFLYEPEFLSLSGGDIHISAMDHEFYEVDAIQKDKALIAIIELENPASAIIFCNTKARVSYVNAVLQRYGYDCDELTADLNQNARERVIERVRAKALRFLVATDVAARGIDIQDLSHVFIYEFPEDSETYIHRAGRTARAGATGTAITLASNLELADVERTVRRYSIEMERRALPSPEEVEAIVAERAISLLESKLRERDKLQVTRMQRFLPLARKLAENADEVQLLAMLIDDFYADKVHGPRFAKADEPRASAPRQGDAPPPRRREEGRSRDRDRGGPGGGGGGGGQRRRRRR